MANSTSDDWNGVPVDDGKPSDWIVQTPEGATMTQAEKEATLRAEQFAEQAGIFARSAELSRDTTAIYLAEARGFSQSAAADRVQTAADRVATGQDRTATGADRVQTAADRVRTGQDRTQTSLDRTASGTARAGAETARTGAETAQGVTQTLRNETETIRDSASGHRAAAQAAATASQGNRDATAADRVQTGQDRAQTALDRTATGQDRGATAADRVQTGQDRTATGQDRTAAAASAKEAAKFDPTSFVTRDGSQSMTNRLALARGTAAAASLVIPAASAEPADNSEAGGLWNGGNALRGFFNGIKRSFYDTTTLPAPTNAEIDAGADVAPKAWSVANVWRAIRALVQADIKRLAMPTFTAVGGETQVIFSIPAGARSVSLEGGFTGSDPANTIMRARLSFDGGSTYLSAADSYQWQNSVFTGTSVATGEATGNAMPFAAPPDGGTALMTQFSFNLEFFPDRHGRFRGRIGAAISTRNRIIMNDGFIRTNGAPTHILIFQQGGTFAAGTQIRAEAR